jgi:threonylcarbamoyladenosine tRNA methylthiotransferase MtaB
MTTFYIEQFGCRATQADAAAIERQLRDRGLSAATESTSADVVIVNTCTVTAAADAQARDAIRKLHAQNPSAQVIATGCYAQHAPEELAQLPGVSWVVGNSHKPQIPQLIGSTLKTSSGKLAKEFVPASVLGHDNLSLLHGPAKILTGNIFEQHELLAAPVIGGEGNHTRPVVKIQDGCNSRCAYCVIPFVRGRSRSLQPATVLDEIARLSSAGYREIVLSGINLGTYGRDLSPRIEFIELLQRILQETSVECLRISSIEPMDVTEDLIALFASTDRIAQHFHMPLQSGCDRVLAAMHRWYRAEHYARRVEIIRDRLPHAAIGADVIAGFPGETDAEHAETVGFIERLPFTYLHVFSFSQRPGTRAAELPGHAPPQTVKSRARELRALGERKLNHFRQSQAGRELRVLTLRNERSWTNATPAISSNYLRISVPGKCEPNQWLDVCVTRDGGIADLAVSKV